MDLIRQQIISAGWEGGLLSLHVWTVSTSLMSKLVDHYFVLRLAKFERSNRKKVNQNGLTYTSGS